MNEIISNRLNEAVVSPGGAVNVAVNVVAPEIAKYADISDNLTPENESFLLEYCTAVRSSVIQYNKDHVGNPPTKAEREVARMGDVIVMTNTLAGGGFFHSRKEVLDLTCAVVDSHYDPRAVVRIVKEPSKLIGIPIVTPTQLSNLLHVWGEIASNMTSSKAGHDSYDKSKAIDSEIKSLTPSIGQVYQALHHLGTNLDALVDENDIFTVAGLLEGARIRVSPQNISNPLKDLSPETYNIVVPRFRRQDDASLSFEPGYVLPRFESDAEIADEADRTERDEYIREHSTN